MNVQSKARRPFREMGRASSSGTSRLPHLSFATLLWVAALLMGAHGVSDPAKAGCARGAVGCAYNTAGTLRACSATLMCMGAPMDDRWNITVWGSSNVTTCSPMNDAKSGATVTFTLHATANATAPATRECTWKWCTFCVMHTMGSLKSQTLTGCQLS